MGAAHPGGPHHGRRPAGDLVDLHLATELAAPVDRAGRGRVPLDVGPIERSVEDVVGRDVDEVGADAGRCLGDVTGAERVDRERGVRVGLAGVDRGVGAAVEDDVGPEGGRPRPGPRRDRPGRACRCRSRARRRCRRRTVGEDARRPPRGRPPSGTRPASTSGRSRPSWPLPPVSRTRRGRFTERGRSAGRRPGALDHRGPVAQRLPPAPVVAVPGHGVGQAPVEGDRSAPSRGRCGSSWSRGGSDGRGSGRSGTISFSDAGRPVAASTASAISSMLASTPLPTL